MKLVVLALLFSAARASETQVCDVTSLVVGLLPLLSTECAQYLLSTVQTGTASWDQASCAPSSFESRWGTPHPHSPSPVRAVLPLLPRA